MRWLRFMAWTAAASLAVDAAVLAYETRRCR